MDQERNIGQMGRLCLREPMKMVRQHLEHSIIKMEEFGMKVNGQVGSIKEKENYIGQMASYDMMDNG